MQLDSDLIGNSYSEPPIVNTTEKEDVDNNEKTMCTKNDKGKPPRKSKIRKIVKKKNKRKFAGLIVEGVPSLWLESEVDVDSILDNMKQSSIYVNCLSKHNMFVVDFQLEFLITYGFDLKTNVILR